MNILLRSSKISKIIKILNKQHLKPAYFTHLGLSSIIKYMFSKQNIKKQNKISQSLLTSQYSLQQKHDGYRSQNEDFKTIIQNLQFEDDQYDSLSQDKLDSIDYQGYKIDEEDIYTLQKQQTIQNVLNKPEQRTNNILKLQNLIQRTIKSQSRNYRYKFIQVDEHKGRQNAQSFMMHLQHNFNKLQITQIIKTIEAYHKNKKNNDKYSSKKGQQVRKRYSQGQDKEQIAIFQEIKQKLVHFMNLYNYHDKNYQYIQLVLDLFAKSHVQHITIANYQTQILQFINHNTNKSMHILKSRQIINQIHQGIKIQRQIKLQPYQNMNKNKHNDEKFDKNTSALQQAFKLKDRAKMMKINLKNSNIVNKQDEKDQPSNKILGQDQPVIYTKKVSISTKQLQQQNKKYIYCFQLPYNIKTQQAQQFISYLNISKQVNINTFYLFSYKQFINKNYQFDIVYKIPDDLNDKTAKIERQTKQIPLQSMIKKNHNRDDKISEALMLKIKKQNYNQFNKSFIILKLQKQSDKMQVFNKTSRLFGINYKNLKNIKMEDGFGKNMVVLKGIPWGVSSKLLQTQINKALKNKNLQVSINVNGNLTSKVVYLKLDYLSQALQVIKLTNNMKIQNTTIKSYLTYGHCKIFNNRYQGKLSDGYDQLKKKINQSKIQYQKFYNLMDNKNK